MPEIKFTRKICKELERVNGMIIPYVASMRNMPGVPDRYLVHKHWSGWLEFKGVHTKLQLNQKLVMRKMRERGCPAFVVREPGVVETEEGEILGEFVNVTQLIQILAANS